MYDIIFLSYNEPNAEKNWELLKQRFPSAKRVNGVKGIHEAHKSAARKSLTKMFWVVDADAKILSTFDFTIHPAFKDIREDTVYVWRSQNPVNGLIYGYGGVKLLPKKLTKNMEISGCDVTTSISSYFMPMPELSNITEFNTDPFNTWKSAFRECVKLSSKTINRQKDEETQERLNIWLTQGADQPFGKYAIEGAQIGIEYGQNNVDNKEALMMINDFDWLEEQFYATYKFSKNTTL